MPVQTCYIGGMTNMPPSRYLYWKAIPDNATALDPKFTFGC